MSGEVLSYNILGRHFVQGDYVLSSCQGVGQWTASAASKSAAARHDSSAKEQLDCRYRA